MLTIKKIVSVCLAVMMLAGLVSNVPQVFAESSYVAEIGAEIQSEDGNT